MSSALADHRALVTGASRGIGRGIALRLAAEGASVIATGRDLEATRQTVEAITAAGGRAKAVIGNICDEEEVNRIVAEAAAAFGGLEVLVNNAGVDTESWKSVHEWDVAEWDRIISTNLRAPFLLSRAVIPHLLDAGGGAMLHISSVCAITAWPGDCAYDVSKAGLNMLSDHIAVEYGPRGIRSNTLMPACIRTDLHEYVMESMDDGREFERTLLARHPIGRFGTVEEIAEAAVPLCAREPAFLTGANIPIDGGYSRI